MLGVMKSAHKKEKQVAFRTFPELASDYERAVESLRGIVDHTDGNDVGIGHLLEYLCAHVVMLLGDERVEFIQTIRRSYTAWLETREKTRRGAYPPSGNPGPSAAYPSDTKRPVEEKDQPARKVESLRRRGRKKV